MKIHGLGPSSGMIYRLSLFPLRTPDFCADRLLRSLIQINRDQGHMRLDSSKARGGYRGCAINARKAREGGCARAGATDPGAA